MNSKYLYWIGIAALVIVALILLFRPLPTSEGAFCDEECIHKTVQIGDFEPNMTAEQICGAGCNIEGWSHYGEIQILWTVYCECCDCVLVGGDMGLPDCADSGLFGYVYAWLGWCEFKD